MIRSADKGAIGIHLFDGVSRPAEGLILVTGREGEKLFVLPQEVWQGKMPGEGKWQDLLCKGMVIWSFADGKSSQEFLREWKNKARQLNIDLRVTPDVLPADPALARDL